MMRQIITLGVGNSATLKFQLEAPIEQWRIIVGMSRIGGGAGANWDRLDKSVEGAVLTLVFKGLLKGEFNLGIMPQGSEPAFYELTFV